MRKLKQMKRFIVILMIIMIMIIDDYYYEMDLVDINEMNETIIDQRDIYSDLQNQSELSNVEWMNTISILDNDTVYNDKLKDTCQKIKSTIFLLNVLSLLENVDKKNQVHFVQKIQRKQKTSQIYLWKQCLIKKNQSDEEFNI